MRSTTSSNPAVTAIVVVTQLSLASACGFLLGEPPQSQKTEELPGPTPPAASSTLPELPAAPEPTAPPPPEPAEPVEPGVRPSGGPTRGKLSKAAVSEGVSHGMPAIEACYQRAQPANPGLRGNIVVNFVVSPEGSVPHAAALEEGTDLPDEGVIDCVLDVFRKLRFEAPVGGRAVVTYPLKFEPSDDTSAPRREP